jgi:hypothetical protein
MVVPAQLHDLATAGTSGSCQQYHRTGQNGNVSNISGAAADEGGSHPSKAEPVPERAHGREGTPDSCRSDGRDAHARVCLAQFLNTAGFLCSSVSRVQILNSLLVNGGGTSLVATSVASAAALEFILTPVLGVKMDEVGRKGPLAMVAAMVSCAKGRKRVGEDVLIWWWVR